MKGASFLELILVVALIGIIAGVGSPFISSFLLRNALDTTTDKVLGTIRKAQNYAINNKNSDIWGVCINGNNIRLYSESCSSPDISNDFSIPRAVTIENLTDTTFSSHRGEPSNTLNITVRTDIGQKNIIVNAVGGIDVQ